MADDYQSQRPCECEKGQISDSSRELDPNYIYTCECCLNLEYERIQTPKPS